MVDTRSWQIFVPLLIASLLLLALISSLHLNSVTMYASTGSHSENDLATIDSTQLTAMPLNATSSYTVHLPIIMNPPGSIYGYISENGVPVSGITVTLSFCRLYHIAPNFDIYCSDRQSFDTFTNDSGQYEYINMPTLIITGGFGLTQTYQIIWENENANPNRLSSWHSQVLDSYTQGERVNLNNFDIGNVDLNSPISDTTTSFPVAFHWTPRASSPSDSYAFCLYGGFPVPPPLPRDAIGCGQKIGYVDSFSLHTPFDGVDYGYAYDWKVQVYDQNGGHGESFKTNRIWFIDQ